MNDLEKQLAEAVNELHQAQERAVSLCDECGKRYSLAVAEAKAEVLWKAELLAAELTANVA